MMLSVCLYVCCFLQQAFDVSSCTLDFLEFDLIGHSKIQVCDCNLTLLHFLFSLGEI